MNNHSALLADLDEFQYRLNCGLKLLLSVHDCGVHGEQDEESFLDALFGACMYIGSLSKELEQIVDNQYAVMHRDNDGNDGENA